MEDIMGKELKIHKTNVVTLIGNASFDKENIVYVIVSQGFKERLLNDLSDISHKVRRIEELSKF